MKSIKKFYLVAFHWYLKMVKTLSNNGIDSKDIKKKLWGISEGEMGIPPERN